MSSSAEVRPLATPELRQGDWTRLGSAAVLGDDVTEDTLGSLAAATALAARSQGYAVGWAAGRRAAREQAEQVARAAEEERSREAARHQREHQARIAALDEAAARLGAAVASVCAQVEERAAELAWNLTVELVGHELSVEGGSAVLARALALTPREPVVAVRLHPDVAASAAAADLAERGVAVVADPALQPGDTVVETSTGAVDRRISTALARVREVVLR